MKKIIKYLLGEKVYELLQNWYRKKLVIYNRRNFYRQFINPGDLVFDVGANVGNRVEAFLNIGAKVIAVEPQEACYSVLEEKFGKKIQIIKLGLGEKDEVKDFYVSDENTISSFSKEWIDSVKDNRFKGNNWESPIKIEITTLDKLIMNYGHPKFIKIDVEGFELQVLLGLTQKIELISFEYTVPEQTNAIFDCLNQIELYNYEIECNYSIGESMEMQSSTWQAPVDFKNHILTDSFQLTGFGDIYVRTK